MINELYNDNKILHKELSKQVKLVNEAEKYQKERDKILDENKELNNKVDKIEAEYYKKTRNLDAEYEEMKDSLEKQFKDKEFDIEYKYKHKIKTLEKENNYLHRIIDKFYETIDKFIHWICNKFDIAEEDNLIIDFQKETNAFINPEKQIKHEEREKEWYLEL